MYPYIFLLFKTVTLAGLELIILLHQLPKC